MNPSTRSTQRAQSPYGGGGQHAHELLEGAEGLAQLELVADLLQAHQVRGERRVVVRVVPVPGAAPLVLVAQLAVASYV